MYLKSLVLASLFLKSISAKIIWNMNSFELLIKSSQDVITWSCAISITFQKSTSAKSIWNIKYS